MGLLVNIEAIDRAGKSTQADDIVPVLEERGVSVVRMAFPDRPEEAAIRGALRQVRGRKSALRFAASGP